MTSHSESPAVDPDNIPETLCLGRFNLTFNGMWATLTFTHQRPKPGPLFDNGVTEQESIVRARIVTTVDNLMALRNLLNDMIKDDPSTATVSAGAKLN